MILDIAIILFLMAVAILLILAEIFLFPGLSVAGIGGAIFAIGGIAFAYSLGSAVGHITLIASVVVLGVGFAWLLRARSFNRLALHTDVDSKLVSSQELGIHPGDEGITLSRLAPIGKARIQGVDVEAKAQDELIDEQTPIVVVQVNGYNVVVRPKQTTNIHA